MGSRDPARQGTGCLKIQFPSQELCGREVVKGRNKAHLGPQLLGEKKRLKRGSVWKENSATPLRVRKKGKSKAGKGPKERGALTIGMGGRGTGQGREKDRTKERRSDASPRTRENEKKLECAKKAESASERKTKSAKTDRPPTER